MLRTALLALALVIPAFGSSTAQDRVPDAREHFNARQGDLVLLSEYLGALHRLSQVCGNYGEGDLYRERMKQVIEGESPPRFTREAMIGAFNRGFRRTSARHLACGRAAEQAFRQEASSAMQVNDRLYAPLRGQ
ncbi:MAG: TIGR02301 family protein [Pseudomonadota bacterium]